MITAGNLFLPFLSFSTTSLPFFLFSFFLSRNPFSERLRLISGFLFFLCSSFLYFLRDPVCVCVRVWIDEFVCIRCESGLVFLRTIGCLFYRYFSRQWDVSWKKEIIENLKKKIVIEFVCKLFLFMLETFL